MTELIVPEKELAVEMYANYPKLLKRLWSWAQINMKGDKSVIFHVTEAAFGSTKNQVLFLSDIHALCTGGEISGSTICMYIK